MILQVFNIFLWTLILLFLLFPEKSIDIINNTLSEIAFYIYCIIGLFMWVVYFGGRTIVISQYNTKTMEEKYIVLSERE